jgi:hypothetical protein
MIDLLKCWHVIWKKHTVLYFDTYVSLTCKCLFVFAQRRRSYSWCLKDAVNPQTVWTHHSIKHVHTSTSSVIIKANVYRNSCLRYMFAWSGVELSSVGKYWNNLLCNEVHIYHRWYSVTACLDRHVPKLFNAMGRVEGRGEVNDDSTNK